MKRCNDEPATKRVRNATRADALAARVRADQALALRLEGRSFREIGAALHCDGATAYRDIARALDELCADNKESAKAMRDLEAQRLDAIFAALWPRVLAGELPATDRVLSVMARRARMYGLDEPVRITATPPDGGAFEFRLPENWGHIQRPVRPEIE